MLKLKRETMEALKTGRVRHFVFFDFMIANSISFEKGRRVFRFGGESEGLR